MLNRIVIFKNTCYNNGKERSKTGLMDLFCI